MRKLLVVAAAGALAAFAAPAYAQSIEGSVSWSSVDTFGVNLNAINAALSWRAPNFFGAEVEAGFGLGDENISPGVNVNFDWEIAAYATATADISENLALFARVGFANVEAGTNTGVDLGDSGLAWGVGGKFFFDGRNGLRADYTKYDMDNDTDVYSLGYVRRF